MVDNQHPDSAGGPPGALKRALAERLIEGRLPSFLAPAVHARIRKDPSWSAHYDSLRRIERAAAGGPAVTASQKELLKTLVFAAAEPPRQRARAAALGLSFAGATAAALLFVTLRGPTPPTDSDLVARGKRDDVPHLGLRARCLDARSSQVVDEAEGGTMGAVKDPVLECPKGGLIAFSLTNLGKKPTHVFVVGVAPDGSLRWYAPFEKAGRSVEVAPGSVDRVLDALADTSQMKDDPNVALFALFSDRPLSSDEVAQAVARAERNGWNMRALSRLPLEVNAQARIDLEQRARERSNQR